MPWSPSHSQVAPPQRPKVVCSNPIQENPSILWLWVKASVASWPSEKAFETDCATCGFHMDPLRQLSSIHLPVLPLPVTPHITLQCLKAVVAPCLRGARFGAKSGMNKKRTWSKMELFLSSFAFFPDLLHLAPTHVVLGRLLPMSANKHAELWQAGSEHVLSKPWFYTSVTFQQPIS